MQISVDISVIDDIILTLFNYSEALKWIRVK